MHNQGNFKAWFFAGKGFLSIDSVILVAFDSFFEA